jgi:sugar phosphate isomerase/epimerase
MNRRTFLAMSAAALAASRVRGAEIAGWHSAFHLMDTWFWNEKTLSIAEQVALLKKAGFAGMALTWGAQHAERIAALKEQNLAVPGCYINGQIDTGFSDSLAQCVKMLEGTRGRVWLALQSKAHKKSDPAGDDAALALVKRCADECKAAGLPGVALYPHVGMWMEKVGDAVRLAEKAAREDIGLQFNQYHWMTADGGRDLEGMLKAAKPHLLSVSINGSELKPSILPLSEGAYDVLPILRTLKALGFEGPIAHQGYSITGNVEPRLFAAMAKWKELSAAV